MADESRNILVTGGTGYIGSHTVVLLVQAGWNVTIVDNLANSKYECRGHSHRDVPKSLSICAMASTCSTGVLERIAKITGKADAVNFVQCDLRNKEDIAKVLAAKKFASVIHFAGYKAVGESRQLPLLYYSNNVKAAVNLVEAMAEAGCKSLVFSSSCTVYGSSDSPLTEESTTGVGITNAYARSKFHIEEMLHDIYLADPTWSICILRYFNPVGAHESGLIGEDPRGIPNCLMPFVLQVLVGRRDKLTIFGDDYATPDGTPVRDYIHVVDVARGHLHALDWMTKQTSAGKGVYDVFNFGTGKGSSVFELISAMEKAAGKKVNYFVGPRRNGDLLQSYCDPTKAATVLGWKAEFGLDKICEDAWRWQSNNPEGFEAK